MSGPDTELFAAVMHNARAGTVSLRHDRSEAETNPDAHYPVLLNATGSRRRQLEDVFAVVLADRSWTAVSFAVSHLPCPTELHRERDLTLGRAQQQLPAVMRALLLRPPATWTVLTMDAREAAANLTWTFLATWLAAPGQGELFVSSLLDRHPSSRASLLWDENVRDSGYRITPTGYCELLADALQPMLDLADDPQRNLNHGSLCHREHEDSMLERLSALGLTTAQLRAIRRSFPEAEGRLLRGLQRHAPT